MASKEPKVTNVIDFDGVIRYEVSNLEQGFNHRLISTGVKGWKAGPWVGYSALATIKVEENIYTVATSYFEGTIEFPLPGELYVIRKVPVQEVTKTDTPEGGN